MTPGDLERDVARYRLTRQQARDRLVICRDLLDKLLDCEDDVERIRTWKELDDKMRSPMTDGTKLLLIWSKISCEKT